MGTRRTILLDQGRPGVTMTMVQGPISRETERNVADAALRDAIRDLEANGVECHMVTVDVSIEVTVFVYDKGGQAKGGGNGEANGK